MQLREGRERTSRRALHVALLTLALLSCDVLPSAAPKPPTGAVGAIYQTASALLAPGADITDMRLEEALEGADLRRALGANADAIIAQVRKTRSAADAGWKPASASGGGPRLASLAAAVGVFSVPMFAQALAGSLDQMTKGSAAIPGRSNPVTSNDTSGGTFTTTTVNVVESFSSEGSRVTVSMSWSYSTASIDNASGQTVLTMRDDRTMVGGIDVCPDASGTVNAALNVKQTVLTDARGTITTRNATSTNAFAGTVGENASLSSVRQTFQEQASWEMSTGTGSYDVAMSATYTASGDGSFLGGMQAGSVSGNVASATGDAEGRLGRSVGFSVAVDALALNDAYQAAQKLWRNGRCVMVEAPSYSAETPIEVAQQEAKQHTEEVDPDSETEISVRLKHRFGGGNLTFPIAAELTNGNKKIEPNRLDSGSGTLKYKAPEEDDKKATARLRTTSKRGIGTLVLEFHTGGALTLTVTGELSSDGGFLGVTTRALDRVTVGPLVFKKTFGDVWEASGTWQAETSSHTTGAGTSQACTGTERGDLTMMARLETRGGNKVWVIDALDANVEDGTGSLTCDSPSQTMRGVTIGGRYVYDADGLSGGIFVGLLDEIVIPSTGGRVPVRGSQSSDRGRFTASGTATGVTGSR